MGPGERGGPGMQMGPGDRGGPGMQMGPGERGGPGMFIGPGGRGGGALGAMGPGGGGGRPGGPRVHSTPRVCVFHNLPEGCKYGDACKFLHARCSADELKGLIASMPGHPAAARLLGKGAGGGGGPPRGTRDRDRDGPPRGRR
eukprot:366241-Chlamydomonas_euryale.AAC.1